MIRRISFVLMLCLAALAPVAAQSYKSLWKSAEDARQKDLPKTALEKLRAIEQKAQRERNTAQLLRAMLTDYQLSRDLSQDSAKVVMGRMETELAKETRAADRALWQQALAKVYAGSRTGRRYNQPSDSAAMSRSQELFRASVEPMEELGRVKAKDYAELFNLAKDSRLYDGDLLSVLAAQVFADARLSKEEKDALRQRLFAHYQARGNRAAMLLTELSGVELTLHTRTPLAESEGYRRLCQLAEEYKDVPQNVETYIAITELSNADDTPQADSLKLARAREGARLYKRNARAGVLKDFIARLEQPSLSLSLASSCVYPGDAIAIGIRARNTREAILNIYRTPFIAEDVENQRFGSLAKDFAKHHKADRTSRHALAAHAAHEWFTDTMYIALDSVGIYVLELQSAEGDTSYHLLHVSRLFPLTLGVRGGEARMTAVDARTGQVLRQSAAKAVRWNSRKNAYEEVGRYGSDSQGNIHLEPTEKYDTHYFLTTPGDRYLPAVSHYFDRSNRLIRGRSSEARIFTDRAIYRPGQEVQFGAVAYWKQGDETGVLEDTELRAILYDANYSPLDTLQLRTDDFGVASGSFTLPTSCLPGNFRLSLTGTKDTHINVTNLFSVEEYKRPTFEVQLLQPTEAYRLGDSLTISGIARTYTGLPLRRANVKYEVENRAWLGAARDYRDNGETTTDDEGRFSIRLFLADDDVFDDMPIDPWYDRSLYFMRHITLTADVTAPNGETQAAALSLQASRRADWVEVDWPEFICREDAPEVVIRHVGAGGRLLPEGGTYEILRGGKAAVTADFKSGEAFTPPFEQLGSGDYEVSVQCNGQTYNVSRFTLVTEGDTRPFGKQALCVYQRVDKESDDTRIMVGTPLRDVTLFCDVIAESKILESRRYTLSDTLLHLNFPYEEAYGDGARVVFGFVKSGKLESATVDITKPEPEKKLQLAWSTFRSQLRPGQEEEWRLHVSHADGTPAAASLMAVLYDASLDQLRANPWNFALHFPRSIYGGNYDYVHYYGLHLESTTPLRFIAPDELRFTTWKPSLFSLYGDVRVRGFGGRVYKQAAIAPTAATGEVMMMRSIAVADAAAVNEGKFTEDLEGVVAEEALATDDDESIDAVPLRTNFSETAFFRPALRTDGKGDISLSFTLPESLTSWQFRAFAHDGAVNHGGLDALVVARKEFMVQGNLPRFVRDGDRVVVPTTLRNLSEQREEGVLTIQVLDAKTERMIVNGKQKFTLEAGGEETFNIPLEAYKLPSAIIVRLMAKGKNFSDGEEHLLPVLTSREHVIRTLPFSLRDAGTQSLRIDTLFAKSSQLTNPRLSVELSANPAWYAVAELPIIANYECHSSTAWATRFYALSLADHIARANPEIRALSSDSLGTAHAWADLLKRNPDLKQTLLQETPWVAEAQTEADRVNALAQLFDESTQEAQQQETLARLAEYQNEDGSYSWFKGMGGNAWITTEVALLLARQQVMTGNERAMKPLRSALWWLEKYFAEEVKEMKKDKEKHALSFLNSELTLKYLYMLALLDCKPSSDVKYLLKHYEEHISSTMYEKAMLALVQARYGKTREAAVTAQSLLEHTVATPAMGSYFDTDRALWCWHSYKLPTQTAAIETFAALQAAGVNVKDVGGKADADLAVIVSDMKLWLLQAKRTQDWDMLRATTDAIYALLLTSARPGEATPLEASSQKAISYQLQRGNTTLAKGSSTESPWARTIGYVRDDYVDAKILRADRITLERKGQDGLSWGAVFAQYELPADEVRASSNGLAVSRRLEVKREGKWLPLSEGESLKKGDRLRQVFTMTADRDYDFVSLKVSRAACLEPTEPLSGYTYSNGIGYYRVVRDASNEYFFETFRKGEHVITEECYVDRDGAYALGTARLQSQYAPEFAGQTSGERLRVEN